ncbi:hypothetical protein [Mammaliicoccus sp. A-M4]|uniref:hypothetical protein n=1 Tax=Mammaliicoccus sp. A-M4 TaxID=2898664 RepID=UPI001EFB2846|nr:hypothetical protein [Mammaliicoccus sp. A-M4]
MEIKFAIFTKNNKVIRLAEADMLEDVANDLLNDYSKNIDDFPNAEDVFHFLSSKGINTAKATINVEE